MGAARAPRRRRLGPRTWLPPAATQLLEFGVAPPDLLGQRVQQLVGLGEAVAAQRDGQAHVGDVLGSHRTPLLERPVGFVAHRRGELFSGRQQRGAEVEQPADQQHRE